MEGLFFLGGLAAIVWLAYWTTLEGQTSPKGKQRWSPFEWREDAVKPDADMAIGRTQGNWRQRAAQKSSRSADSRRR